MKKLSPKIADAIIAVGALAVQKRDPKHFRWWLPQFLESAITYTRDAECPKAIAEQFLAEEFPEAREERP